VNQSFARRYRLTKTDDFSSVFGFRRAIRGKLLMLHYQPRAEGMNDPRLGLVVGKKQLKKAVDRNIFKRVIREQFRLCRAELPAVDLVVRLAVKPVKTNRQASLPMNFCPAGKSCKLPRQAG
jgi:ribonuclease P protein component